MDRTHELIYAEWTLRIALCLMFLGHGILAVMQKQGFIDLVTGSLGIDAALAATLVFWIGIIDVIMAFVLLFAPLRIFLLGAALWSFATALSRPLSADAFFGPAFLDLVERGANYGLPLALLFLRGTPRTVREWFR